MSDGCKLYKYIIGTVLKGFSVIIQSEKKDKKYEII